MPRPRTPYDTNELEIVKNNLSGILTRESKDITNWIRKDCPHEIRKLAEVFKLAASELHHKWQAAVLAQIPVSAVVEEPDDVLYIKPSSTASMRYLSREPLSDGYELQQVHTRQILLESLLEHMPLLCQRHYSPMLRWVAYNKHGNAAIELYPQSSDTAFGYNLSILEELQIKQLNQYVANWRAEINWPESESTPFEVTQECSLAALNHLRGVVARWYQEGESMDRLPESMLARVSANLSVNRALLELAAMDACGIESAFMSEKILYKLNLHGVVEVPPIINDCSPEEYDDLLRKVLTSWLGYGGSMLQQDTLLDRPMSKSDIDTVVLWSLLLQETYIKDQSTIVGGEAAYSTHGSTCNRFIFAVVMVGAFYCKTRVANEFSGHSNSTYAVFPDRGDAIRCNGQQPPAHAAHILIQAYSQIFYANSGWGLRAERVSEYAKLAHIKRAHSQTLLYFAVKNRTSRELLMLHKKLEYCRG